MKQYIITLLIVLSALAPSHAVEKGKNIDNTLGMLCIELESLKTYQPIATTEMEQMRSKHMENLRITKEHADELSIVLFSQRNINLFARTYSTKLLRDLCDQFESRRDPFDDWHAIYDSEIARYGRLQRAIEGIDPANLSSSSRLARIRAIEDCRIIDSNMTYMEHRINESSHQFAAVSAQLDYLNQCADSSYSVLREELFTIPIDSYFSILANFGQNVKQTQQTIWDRYFNENYYSHKWVTNLRKFLFISLIFLIISCALAYGVIRGIISLKRRSHEFRAKWKYYWVVLTLMIQSIMLFTTIQFVSLETIVVHATMLNIELSWLICTILLSLTVRMPSNELRNGLMLYLPAMILGTMLIIYRVLIIPNNVVQITMPPMILAILISYMFILFKYGRTASRTDTFYAWLSFLIILGGTILAWVGHPFMALLTQMLWLVSLSCIQMLITINKLILISDNKYRAEHHITRPTWFYAMMIKLIMPIMCITIVVVSCLWTSRIFDMSGLLLETMQLNFINIPTIASISIIKIIWVIFIAICINYLIFVLKEVLRSIYGSRCDSGFIPILMVLVPLLSWGIYACMVIVIMDVDSSGLLVVMGGLSMGIGFALKDTIDNLLCGFSLMFGRVQLGDVVECDGIRGKITSLGYRSTMLEAEDGSVIAFLNNQLFTKNFKNMTRNHTYEMVEVKVGLAYGTNIESARQVILEAIRSIRNLHKEHDTVVILNNFGESSVDLIARVWIPVRTRYSTLSAVNEAIYTALEKNSIVIAFPQQDIHIINDSK